MIAQKRKNKKKWLWWGAGLVIVAIIAIIGVIIWQNNQPKESVQENNEPEKVEQKEKVEDTKQSESENKDEEVAKQQKVVQYEGEDPNKAENLSGVVTYAGVNGSNLIIRTSIDQYLTEGVCELTLVQGGAIIYSGTTNIVGDVSTARCEGFDIPVAGLGGGNTEIIIKLKAGEREGSIRGGVNI